MDIDIEEEILSFLGANAVLIVIALFVIVGYQRALKRISGVGGV